MQTTVNDYMFDWITKRFSWGGDWLAERGAYAFSGGPTAAGVFVDVEQALKQPHYRAGINRKSADMARLPVGVYRLDEKGKKIEQRNHQLWRILRSRPNPHMTGFDLRQQQWGNLLPYGNAYSRIVRDKITGEVVEMWPLQSAHMEVYADGQPWAGELWPLQKIEYRYQRAGAPVRIFQPEEIFHLSDLTLDGFVGRSAVEDSKETIALALATDRFAATHFGNNGKPGLLLSHPGTFANEEDEKEALREWNKKFSGSKAHSVGFLKKGWTVVQEFRSKPDEAQMIQSRQMSRENMATASGTPPHLIGDLTQAHFSNVSQMGREYVSFSLASYLAMYEQEVERQLLTDRERDDQGVFVKHDFRDLLKGDIEKQGAYLRLMVQWSLMTINEARAEDGRDPVDGGGVFLRPLNMAAVDMAGNILPGQDHLAKGAEPAEPATQDEIAAQIKQLTGKLEVVGNA